MIQGLITLGVFVSSLIAGAAGDALDDKAGSRFGHGLKALEIGILLMSPFVIGEYSGIIEAIVYGAAYTALRVALFDPLYNIFHGNPINYMGTKSWWDRKFGAVPVFGRWIYRSFALVFGVAASIIGVIW